MTVTKRALEDDHCEIAPQAKKIATTATSVIAISTLLRSSTQADTTESMTVSKRALEDDHGEAAPQAKKIATSETAVLNDERLQPYLDRIAELERMIGEYETFIHREGLLLGMYTVTSLLMYLSPGSPVLTDLMLDLPSSLQTIIDSRPKAAAKLASNLKRNIRMAYEKLYDADGPEINNDDYADELVSFLPDVKRLAKLQDGPCLAWNVLLLLVDKSRSDEPGNGYNRDDPDSPYYLLDKTMVEVAKARWEGSKLKMGEESKEMLQDAIHIASVAKLLDDHGIKEYLEMTIAYLDKILVMIYPDRYDVQDEEGDDGADDAKDVSAKGIDAKVGTAKQDKHHDIGVEHEAISRFLNREEAPIGGLQFGNGNSSLPRKVDHLAKVPREERVPLLI
ncbi:hypothetical protein MMC17_002466 [Xylographa soralifera]|nr:hypothetical protein [Xylographa soralifera]